MAFGRPKLRLKEKKRTGGLGGGHLSQQRQRTVPRAVVYKNNLGVIVVGQAVQDFAQDAVEVRHLFLLFVNGRDDANQGLCLWPCASSVKPLSAPLPPCGGGLGWLQAPPPPQPSPARGRE